MNFKLFFHPLKPKAMKTLQFKIGKMTNRIAALLILVAGFVFLTGCQKEDLATNAPGMNSSSDLSKNVRSINNDGQAPRTVAFNMITIDHDAGKADAADYRVEVSSDGTVLFIGRRNTTTFGKYQFQVSDATITALRNLFIESNFAEMDDELPRGTGMPGVYTSFRSSLSAYPVTHVDIGRKDSKLIQIRTKAEDILGISKYVNGAPEIEILIPNVTTEQAN
jgi:hypothetical protein